MSENRINICVIGGTEAELEEVSDIIAVSELSCTFTLVNSKSKLLEIIGTGHCHLIIGNCKHKDFNVFNAADIVTEQGNHISCVGVFETAELSVVEAMQQGLSDYIDIENHQHLHLVVERELTHVLQLCTSTSVGGRDFTGLYSRLQFLEYFENKLSTKTKNDKETALLYLQLDNFNLIKESIGILSGDIFLKNTAKVIDNLLERDDVAARYQGGSFILLLEGETIKKISAKADIIREAIGEAISKFDNNNISSTCSIGINYINNSKDTLQVIISNAFDSSEKAKFSGGNAVHHYHETEVVSSEVKEKQAWDVRFREAFEKDLFVLFYQPIISLKADDKPRYEALIRMTDEGDNIVSPATFIPFAERAGLMSDIDRRVILYSLHNGVEEKKKGNEMEIFIKLSGSSINDEKMLTWISETIKEIKFPSKNIVFEISESLAFNHLTQTLHLVKNLKKLNCKIAINHFGTRLKSFKLLEPMDIDYLKIDSRLIQNLASNKAHQVIVKEIVKAAYKNKIKLIAECIQEAGSLPVIWQYNIHFVQGYFLQIPDQRMEYDFSNLLM
ncbi:MAG: bifunctional diguanylate cyclase/phosphodiesterase [Gammaproteobacteria bacterium]|nr:bifunctional diguanylate cyclase/phosphodiesterase [Gammaproteobacteria bacterium]